uniref:Uncharacterized protein n=1 Tax=Arundo donax TaxID=35708 RepID=A0A0A8Z1N9_ARUDO
MITECIRKSTSLAHIALSLKASKYTMLTLHYKTKKE